MRWWEVLLVFVGIPAALFVLVTAAVLALTSPSREPPGIAAAKPSLTGADAEAPTSPRTTGTTSRAPTAPDGSALGDELPLSSDDGHARPEAEQQSRQQEDPADG